MSRLDCGEVNAVLHTADAGLVHAEGEEPALDLVASERIVDPGGVRMGRDALEAPALHAEGELVNKTIAGTFLRVCFAVVNPGDPFRARALFEGKRGDNVAEVVAHRDEDIRFGQLGCAESPKRGRDAPAPGKTPQKGGDEIAPEAEGAAGFGTEKKRRGDDRHRELTAERRQHLLAAWSRQKVLDASICGKALRDLVEPDGSAGDSAPLESASVQYPEYRLH